MDLQFSDASKPDTFLIVYDQGAEAVTES